MGERREGSTQQWEYVMRHAVYRIVAMLVLSVAYPVMLGGAVISWLLFDRYGEQL